MPTIAPRQIWFIRLIVLCALPSCTNPGAPVGYDDTTAGASTTQDDIATATDTPTTTVDDPSTTAGDGGPTSTTSTSDAPGTNSDEMTTMAGSPECGNGQLNEGEQCDDGLDGNGDTRYCKTDCMLNECGDGSLFVGLELCDEGAGNSDEYGSLCGEDCQPGARCGDHKVQPDFETCDLGHDNGGREGDNQGILCDESCKAQQLRGFVTKDSFTGDLGGLFGADLKCQTAAKSAGLAEPERFHAYLSTAGVDAKDRFQNVVASFPYVIVTGTKVADNFAALIEAGPIGEGIVVTEYGTSLYEQYVATNTAPGGLSFSPDQHCQGWTSAELAHAGRVGLSGVPAGSPDAMTWKTTQAWTGVVSWPCHKNVFHLYCLEI
jgi:hypothetical protein